MRGGSAAFVILGTVLAASLLASTGASAALAAAPKETYQKYSWSPTIYKVVNGKASALTADAWRKAGSPKPTVAKATIPGSYIWKWGTNDQLGIIEPNGKYHWLTYSQWKGMGFPGISQNRANEGFVSSPGITTSLA